VGHGQVVCSVCCFLSHGAFMCFVIKQWSVTRHCSQGTDTQPV
jgi:uncharacterized membrane protein